MERQETEHGLHISVYTIISRSYMLGSDSLFGVEWSRWKVHVVSRTTSIEVSGGHDLRLTRWINSWWYRTPIHRFQTRSCRTVSHFLLLNHSLLRTCKEGLRYGPKVRLENSSSTVSLYRITPPH